MRSRGEQRLRVLILQVSCSVIFDQIRVLSIYQLVNSRLLPPCDLCPKERYCESEVKSGCIAIYIAGRLWVFKDS
jgi:hypothetical protein